MSSQPLLAVRDLETWFGRGTHVVRAVDGLSFEIARGETLALLGESGSGKSIAALSILGLVPQPAGRVVGGSIKLDGEELLTRSEVQMRDIRGRRISMIFQDAMTSLNPVLTVGEQIMEVLRLHRDLGRRGARDQTLELLDAVGIPDRERRIDEYPHNLSGGMKQRVMIAGALACEPDLLIADEPTTALDVTIQAQVLDLLAHIQRERDLSILLITHDLGVVSGMADRVAVMYAGHLVEEAEGSIFFRLPKHPYSIRLFAALPETAKRDHTLAAIPGTVPALDEAFAGCRFANRCDLATPLCDERPPRWLPSGAGQEVRCHLADPEIPQLSERDEKEGAGDPLTGPTEPPDGHDLDVAGLTVHFPIKSGILKRTTGHVFAVDGVSFVIEGGRTYALVGESGCGKTTVGKSILRLIEPTAGTVRYGGDDLAGLPAAAMRGRRRDLQIVFQDPYSAMDPRMRVGDIIEEGMKALLPDISEEERRARTERLLEQVGLSPDVRDRYPHEFSGGQRQRVAIARTLAVEPRAIVCDEPTSALDVSVQAQILNLLKKLQLELGLSYLFITHDISVVSYVAHTVGVMYLGRIVEEGPVDTVLSAPAHPYTRALVAAVPSVSGPTDLAPSVRGELPSPITPPGGCHFHPRCPDALPECRASYPPAMARDGHAVRCFVHGAADE